MDVQSDAPAITELAQELVNVRRDISELEARSAVIKRNILQSMPQGAIQCIGGRVTVIQEQQVLQLDTETLIQLLFERSNLSRFDAEALVRDGKISRPRDSYVAVRLETNVA